MKLLQSKFNSKQEMMLALCRVWQEGMGKFKPAFCFDGDVR